MKIILKKKEIQPNPTPVKIQITKPIIKPPVKIQIVNPSVSPSVKTELQLQRIANMSKSREAKRLKIESGESVKHKNPMEKHLEDPKSMRRAINANCYDCCGMENFRRRIRFCNVFKCPFWLLRPYSKGISTEQCESWKEDGKADLDTDTDVETEIDVDTEDIEEDIEEDTENNEED